MDDALIGFVDDALIGFVSSSCWSWEDFSTPLLPTIDSCVWLFERLSCLRTKPDDYVLRMSFASDTTLDCIRHLSVVPAKSCDQLAQASPGSPPGMYWVGSDEDISLVRCEF